MEKERLLFCIERFDHYYDSINNKSAVFLGLGTFALGGLIAAYPYLSDHSECRVWITLLLSIPIGLALAAMLIVMIASIPFVSKGDGSLYYFGSIASKGREKFHNTSEIAAPGEELSDLREQVFELSTGLKRKFNRLRIAGILYVLMFISIIPLVLTILLNFKN